MRSAWSQTEAFTAPAGYVGRHRANEDGTPRMCPDPAGHRTLDQRAAPSEASWWRRARGWCGWCGLRLP